MRTNVVRTMNQGTWKSITAVVVDPFRSDQLAAVKAAAIASRCGAKLTLLNTFMLPQPTPESVLGNSKQIIASAARQRLLLLRKLAARLAKRGIEVRCVVEWDYPVHEAVVRHVLKTKPDLIVAESHRHGRIARWILANTDWELIRSCPCPLWFTRSESLPSRPRVLVAVDPRHSHDKPARLDDRLLKTANVVVEELGGSVDIVHVWRNPLSTSPGMFMAPVRIPRRALVSATFVGDLERDVALLASRHGFDDNRCFIKEGDTAEVLATFAKKRGSDVLVMGAVSRSFATRPLIGNTAEKVIDHVGCDVLVVKPAGFKAPARRARPRV